jgi:hypothetical protein
MARVRRGHLTRWRPLGPDIASKGDVSGAPRLQWDGVRVEVPEHVKHGLEPQVLYVALTVAVEGQAQMLWTQGRNGQQWDPWLVTCLASAFGGSEKPSRHILSEGRKSCRQGY